VAPQGRYVFIGAAFERIFGYAPKEVIGRPMIQLAHPDERERALQAPRRQTPRRHRANATRPSLAPESALLLGSRVHRDRCGTVCPRRFPATELKADLP